MSHNTTEINPGISVVVDILIHKVVDNSFTARGYVARAAIIRTSFLEWKLLAPLIMFGTKFREVEWALFGLIMYELVWIFPF